MSDHSERMKALYRNRRLRPLAEKYAEIIRDIGLTETAELKRMLKDCDAVGTGDCWWAVYSFAKTFRAAIADELESRKRREEKKKK